MKLLALLLLSWPLAISESSHAEDIINPHANFMQFTETQTKDLAGNLYFEKPNRLVAYFRLLGMSSLKLLQTQSFKGLRVTLHTNNGKLKSRELVQITTGIWKYTSGEITISQQNSWPLNCVVKAIYLKDSQILNSIFGSGNLAASISLDLSVEQREVCDSVNHGSLQSVEYWTKDMSYSKTFNGIDAILDDKHMLEAVKFPVKEMVRLKGVYDEIDTIIKKEKLQGE